MTPKRQEPSKWWNSLRIRLVVMMSLALLPVGLIAIYQTRAVSEKARRNTELALMALVEQSALEERLAIQRAFGAADGVAAIAIDLASDPVVCSAHMKAVVEQSQRFSFAGILEADGMINCSSTQTVYDFSENDNVRKVLRNPDRLVRINFNAPVSQSSVINVSVPVMQGGSIFGRVSVSIPQSTLETSREIPREALTDIVTFNDQGNVLTYTGEAGTFNARLPRGLSLVSLIDRRSRAFSSVDRRGHDRIYTVVPIEPHQLYVLAIWDAKKGLAAQTGDRFPPILFPALMWLTSLAVVLFAVHRLVSRHVRNLRRQMVRFAADRTMSDQTVNAWDMPNELFEMQSSFSAMAYSIMQDEANLEDAVREKNVLIREIHHRVKNNLQLISSILNMQIRNSDDPSTRTILRRIQDRVLSLATIHRDLYQASTAGQVNVGSLITEIIEKSVDIGAENADAVKVETEIDPVMLYPDQAVPMSLLAAEATTNAMKYVSAAEGEEPWIRVSLTRGEDNQCVFRFSNSAGGTVEAEGSGLGTKLIQAFAIQLGALTEVEHADGVYTMTVTFEVADFVHEAADY